MDSLHTVSLECNRKLKINFAGGASALAEVFLQSNLHNDTMVAANSTKITIKFKSLKQAVRR